MIITWWRGLFIADRPDSLEQSLQLSRAGWTEHVPLFGCPPFCKACEAKVGRRYFTNAYEFAAPFTKFFNTAAKEFSRKKTALIEKSRATNSEIYIPSPPGLEYLGYQKAGIEYASQRKDTLIADSMGLGKTVQALGFINKIKPEKVLIVCPKSIKYNWLEEAKKWLVEDRWKFKVIDDNEACGDANFVIVNYEKLVKTSPLTASLRQIWDVLVCDEAHLLKTPSSQRTIAVLGKEGLALMRRSRRALFLTGTPIMNAPRELWPILSAIAPVQFGDWGAFMQRYCQPRTDQTGRTRFDGGTNLDELQTRLRTTCMVRRLKSEVLKDLPPKIRQLVSLDDGLGEQNTAVEKWNRLFKEKVDKAEAKAQAAKSDGEFKEAVKEMDAVVGIAFEEMSKYRHETAVRKLPLAMEYIESYLAETESKIIIFAHHKDVLEPLLKHFGDRAVGLWGDGASDLERQNKVRAFQENPEIRIFIGGLKAAGFGITLTAAEAVIFVEGDWTPATMMQAEDRAHRIGQEKPVHIIQLVLRDTLDANMAKFVQRKMVLAEKTLDRKLRVENG